MKEIFEELEAGYIHIQAPEKFDGKESNFGVHAYMIISIIKGKDTVKRFKVVDRYSNTIGYHDSMVHVSPDKGIPTLDFIFNPENRVYNKFALSELGSVLQFIGDPKLVENYTTSAMISTKVYSVDTAIVHIVLDLKPCYKSINKKFNKRNFWTNNSIYISPIKYNKGKLNRNEMNYTIYKKVIKVDVL